MRFGSVFLMAGMALAGAGAPALAERTLQADQYLDRLRGMWLGEIMGNYAGKPSEGKYYNVRSGNPAETIDWSFVSTNPWNGYLTNPWQGDDDTGLEYLNIPLIAAFSIPCRDQMTEAWKRCVTASSFYIANRQARYLMDYGLRPPDTGSLRYNMHWYAIDSQITTESTGAAAPGMRQHAADLAGTLGSITNDGYALHAAQFYAAMYSAAPLETDVETVVTKGLEVVPRTSRTYQVIKDVCDWYAADQATPTPSWRHTREKLYDKYVNPGDNGRYRDWIESTVNVGLTTMAILYGHGDFKETVRIGVLGGFDADCNPATAGGLIGMMKGYSALPADLTGPASDGYHEVGLQNIIADTTVSKVAALWQNVAEGEIVRMGGSIDGSGPAAIYHLPDDILAPLVEKPDPTGPKGLVALVKSLGGTVTAGASVESHLATWDRSNLDQIMDGITDVSYNGRLPYSTRDGPNPQPAGGDWYQLNFDRKVAFASLVFYEGDIIWDHINADPRSDEPLGGYFLNLTVEVGNDGVFAPVANLHFSEPLDPYVYFQQIEMTFDEVLGNAIRIRGDAGGKYQFTTIVELETYGHLPEPATLALLAVGLVLAAARRHIARRVSHPLRGVASWRHERPGKPRASRIGGGTWRRSSTIRNSVRKFHTDKVQRLLQVGGAGRAEDGAVHQRGRVDRQTDVPEAGVAKRPNVLGGDVLDRGRGDQPAVDVDTARQAGAADGQREVGHGGGLGAAGRCRRGVLGRRRGA